LEKTENIENLKKRQEKLAARFDEGRLKVERVNYLSDFGTEETGFQIYQKASYYTDYGSTIEDNFQTFWKPYKEPYKKFRNTKKAIIKYYAGRASPEYFGAKNVANKIAKEVARIEKHLGINQSERVIQPNTTKSQKLKIKHR